MTNKNLKQTSENVHALVGSALGTLQALNELIGVEDEYVRNEVKEALRAIAKAAGFRVAKPKRVSKGPRPALNAVGKPFSKQFDPQRKSPHKPSTSHLFQPYPRSMRFVGEPAPKAPSPRYARADERKRQRAQAGAPAWLREADERNG